jgi:putative transposase
VLKSFKFRIFPSKKQIKQIDLTLDLCKNLYNSGLEHRILCCSKGTPTSYVGQANELSTLKEYFPEYNNIYAQVLQDVLKRLDKSYQNFFRRIKSGNKPGFPRFKRFDRYSSFTYPQNGFSIIDNKLKLSKIGLIKIKLHREIIGKIKTCSIIRSSGKYYACFSCELPDIIKLNKFDNIIAIDLGIKTLAVDSNGESIFNPKILSQHKDKLAKAQRKLEKIGRLKANRSKREAQKNHIARIYEKITNVRSDFLHKTSRKLVNKYDVIILEKLNISNMFSNKTYLNRSINDVAWATLTQMITYKAEEAGKHVIFVNPRNTSQECSGCGAIVKKDLSVRIHDCKHCGLVIDRDLNAAKNILNRGMSQVDKLRENRNIFSESSEASTCL